MKTFAFWKLIQSFFKDQEGTLAFVFILIIYAAIAAIIALIVGKIAEKLFDRDFDKWFKGSFWVVVVIEFIGFIAATS